MIQKSACKNISVDGIMIKEKGLHIAACIRLDSFTGSSDCIDRFKRGHNIVYRNEEGERRCIDIETVDAW
jgi:hypothetical protein